MVFPYRLTKALSDSLSLKIYNNTFYHNATDGSEWIREIYIESNSADISVLEIRNNIIYAVSTSPLIDADGDITAHSNNIYYRAGGGELVRDRGTTYTSGNLGSWEPSAYAVEPNFKNSSNLPAGFKGTYGTDMEPNTDGLSVEQGIAVDNGADLGDLYYGAINFAGKSGGLTRPQGSGWDIGAYEYSTVTGINDIESDNVINEFVLSQNYPNPFNSATVINYNIPKAEFVILKVYNILGEEIAALVNEFQQAGTYSVKWDGIDKNGNNSASGIYFYKIQNGCDMETRKMLFLK